MKLATNIFAQGYDALADEYYDRDAHPTCNNFNQLSRLFFEDQLLPSDSSGGIVEVGAGDSLVASILSKRGVPLAGLELVDSSESMLRHSRKWLSAGVRLTVSDACHLDRPDRSVKLLVASLGDPFNTAKFWSEAARVLSLNGRVLFTLPAFDWACQFRNTLEINRLHAAEFLLKNGRELSVPSFVYSKREQIDLVRSAGLQVTEFREFYVEDLAAPRQVSPKLYSAGGSKLAVLWGIVADFPKAAAS